MPIERHRLPCGKYLAGFGHQEASDRRVALRDGQINLQPAIKIADGEAAIKQVAAVWLLIALFVDLFVMLVRDVADDLLEQVLERNDALDAAVLIDDKAEMKLLVLHLTQHILEPRRIDHVIRFVDDRIDPELIWLANVADEIFAVYDAGDVVERVAIYRQTRVAAAAKRP